MKHHMWVAISYTPIEVQVDTDGTLHTFTTEMGEELARDDAKLGCWHCMIPLNTETYGTECLASSDIDADLDSH